MWQSNSEFHHGLCTRSKQSQEHQLCSKVLNAGNRQMLMGLFKGNTWKKKAILEIISRGTPREPTGEKKGSESKKIQEIVLPAYRWKSRDFCMFFTCTALRSPSLLKGSLFPMASRKACSWNSAPGSGLPSAQSPRSVSGHLCPGNPCGCCRWASAGTDRAASTSSCRRHRTPQSPACPGCHLCQPPAAHSNETIGNPTACTNFK